MPEYFFSIAIEENSIASAIWGIKEGAAYVLATSNTVFWEDDETLVTSADECLSSCAQKLPSDATEPSKTVFGVPSSWVADGQIERQYLDKIRLLCNKLSLTPTGFVVLPEAIAHFEKSQQKTPMTGILIGVYPQSIDVSLFKLGSLAGSVNVARSSEIADDVVEGLARFGTQEMFPSRFLLYNSKMDELEEVKQNLIKRDWVGQGNIKFLHTPQVEIIKNDELIAAVSLAGAAEMGQTTAFHFEKGETKKTEDTSNYEEDNIVGTVDPASLGFTNDFENTPLRPNDANAMLGRQGFAGQAEKGLNDNKLFIGVVVAFFILVGGFCAFWFLPKAQLTIYVSPQQITGRENVKFDTGVSSVDTTKLIIPAKNVNATVSGSKTKATSGTATIGTAARGSVTFYNVGGSTTIPSGTTLTASNLNFTLDADVQMASASGAASAATAKGNITSSGVGADYNLAGGTYFAVGNFSSSLLQAKNDSDLAGGSSQEVTAVSKDDMNSLIGDLTRDLTKQGTDQLKNNLNGNILVDSSVTATPSSKTFDHASGDQATTLKLNESMKVGGVTVSKKDLNDLAKQIFSGEVKNGYEMSDSQIDFQFEAKDVNFIINLLPKVNNNTLASKIAGKKLDDAKKTLQDIPGYSDAQVVVRPSFLGLGFLPHVPANISIDIIPK